MFYVYILANQNKRLYVGYCEILSKRLKEHNSGSVKYTAPFVPWSLVYYEKLDSKKDAVAREKQIKKWSRQKKINLITPGHPTKF
jgi:putative endonuclease